MTEISAEFQKRLGELPTILKLSFVTGINELVTIFKGIFEIKQIENKLRTEEIKFRDFPELFTFIRNSITNANHTKRIKFAKYLLWLYIISKMLAYVILNYYF